MIIMKKIVSAFMNPLGILILLLFNASSIEAQELDSVQIKAIRMLGPEKIQSLLENMADNGPAEYKTELKKALAMMKIEEPTIETVTLKDKTVKFIPIAHAGQKKFYDKLTSIISEYKNMGYVVFYEQLKPNKFYEQSKLNKSIIGLDTIRLKYRKIVGREPTRKMYSLLTIVFPNVVVQPEYNLLGITDTDVNADVSIDDFVGQYEKLYGPVILEACDFEAKIGTLTTCKPLENNLDAVILNYRNENLVNMVKKSKQKKILVIYGANHVVSMIGMLKGT